MKVDGDDTLDQKKSDAYFMLGMYFLEKGIRNESMANQKIQFDEAYKYFKQSAEKMHLLGMYQLGVMH